jgi:hypothetical protein
MRKVLVLIKEVQKSGGRTLIASQYQNWFSRVYDEIQKNKGAN